MSHGSCLSRLSEPEPHHVLPWPALYVMENTLQLWILKNNKRDATGEHLGHLKDLEVSKNKRFFSCERPWNI
jgi:hypothetical protein